MAVYIAMATGCMVMFSTIVPRAWCSERLTADSAHGEQILALHHEIGSIDVEYLATTDNHESEDPMSYMEVRYIAKERKRLRHAAHWSTMRSRASDIINLSKYSRTMNSTPCTFLAECSNAIPTTKCLLLLGNSGMISS